jgi:hypothetical protein
MYFPFRTIKADDTAKTLLHQAICGVSTGVFQNKYLYEFTGIAYTDVADCLSSSLHRCLRRFTYLHLLATSNNLKSKAPIVPAGGSENEAGCWQQTTMMDSLGILG